MRIGTGLGLVGTVAAVGLAGCAGVALGASEPQAPVVRYEHSETLAEGTMDDGSPARIVQSAYGDANSLSVRESMEISGQVVGAMGLKMTEENRVCKEKELYLSEVTVLGVDFPGEITFGDRACDGLLDYLTIDDQTVTRDDFGAELDEMYQVLEEVVSDELSFELRMQEWNAQRGL
ncbi:MAG: hypothetical protein KJ955_05235 [Nanoarchaeota archaeon]|nr:hypothetical protein [Nanoarchaeota archaeon]